MVSGSDAIEGDSGDLTGVMETQDACDARPRSCTPFFSDGVFRGAGSAASPSLASSPWRTSGVRSRPAPGPPTGGRIPRGPGRRAAVSGLPGLRRRRVY